jgi:hypothetical protein
MLLAGKPAGSIFRFGNRVDRNHCKTMVLATTRVFISFFCAKRRHEYLPLRTAIFVLLWNVAYIGVALAQNAQLKPITQPIESKTPRSLMLEHLPPNKPTVTYENGLLTITANNSTLSDILREVQNETGAEIDIPPQAEERVAARLGPGPARDVLASLLTGSRFNYVLVGSNLNSAALTKVLLFLKPPPQHSTQVSASVAQSSLQKPGASEVEIAQEYIQQAPAPSDPTAPARAQQQMLQQYRQSIMQQFRQNAH